MPLPLALIPVLAPLVPGIVKALAGDRAGEVAAQVTTAVRAVVGTDDPELVREALADPQQASDLLMELGRIERDHEREMLRLTLADVAGARAHQVALAQGNSWMAAMPAIWALMTAAGFFAVLASLLFTSADYPPAVRELLLVMLGALLREFAGSGQYWTGSSSGSARKDEALRGQGR